MIVSHSWPLCQMRDKGHVNSWKTQRERVSNYQTPTQGNAIEAQIGVQPRTSNITQQEANEPFDVFCNPEEHQWLFEAVFATT